MKRISDDADFIDRRAKTYLVNIIIILELLEW